MGLAVLIPLLYNHSVTHGLLIKWLQLVTLWVWLLFPSPLSSCFQISSQLSKFIDIADVKSVLSWKRFQDRNIINYPPAFHQMTSLISAVPDRAALRSLCTCICLHTCPPVFVLSFTLRSFSCVCKCTFVCLQMRLYMRHLHVFNLEKALFIFFSSSILPS